MARHGSHQLSGVFPVENWTHPPAPTGVRLEGRYAELVALDAGAHCDDLFDAYEDADQVWNYLPYGPFPDYDAYKGWLRDTVKDPETLFYAVKNKESDRFEGVASYLRIDPKNGSIEVGHINFSPRLQRTRTATDAMFLMMQWAFDAGYRRYEWKCDAANKPSRRAAQRLGFSYEGVFRQAAVVKGRNRDTAWFACIDSEWPALKAAFEKWLGADNFVDGRQVKSLTELTSVVRVTRDPVL